MPIIFFSRLHAIDSDNLDNFIVDNGYSQWFIIRPLSRLTNYYKKTDLLVIRVF